MNSSTNPAATVAPRVPVLDGVRGIAILMVMLRHFVYGAKPSNLVGEVILVLCNTGRVGVDLFFVLSGFLITRILLRTRADSRYFRNSYARRALRIFPVYYAYLIFYFGFVTRFTHFDRVRAAEASSYQGWVWLYATNILICLRGNYVVASVNHFWTLAVEEHFYLIWPALIRRLDLRRMVTVCGVAFVIAVASRALVTLQNWSAYAANVFTLCRVDSLAAGALLAVFELTHSVEAIASGARRVFWIFVGPVVVGAFLVNGSQVGQAVAEILGSSAVAVLFASVIALAVWGQAGSLIRRFFGKGFFCWLGTYAYGLYVFHQPMRIFLERVLPFESLGKKIHSYALGLTLHGLLTGTASLIVAWLSYRLFETPILRLKRFFEPDADAPKPEARVVVPELQ